MPRNSGADSDRGAKRQSKAQDEGQAERSFAEKGPVARKAREAAQALSSPEGAELEQVRRETRKGPPRGKRRKSNAGGEAHPHTEDNLDHGLKETFPASDPVSISPGAD